MNPQNITVLINYEAIETQVLTFLFQGIYFKSCQLKSVWLSWSLLWQYLATVWNTSITYIICAKHPVGIWYQVTISSLEFNLTIYGISFLF
jgi:hypothetical protein